MKIAILGYGRMGKEIEELALEMSHEIILKIDNETDWSDSSPKLHTADVAIEFSQPETAATNILRCFEAGIPVVSGTTGWTSSFEEIRHRCIEEGHAFFYASNFSPGMNMMFELNRKLAELMSKHPSYRILIEEIHHSGKLDAPSGTAISLAKDIIDSHPVKEDWVNKPASGPEELEIISIRRNQVPVTHFVKYDNAIDSLEIKHTAHSRKGFALGALMAAEWLIGKKGCYGMTDLLYDH